MISTQHLEGPSLLAPGHRPRHYEEVTESRIIWDGDYTSPDGTSWTWSEVLVASDVSG